VVFGSLCSSRMWVVGGIDVETVVTTARGSWTGTDQCDLCGWTADDDVSEEMAGQ